MDNEEEKYHEGNADDEIKNEMLAKINSLVEIGKSKMPLLASSQKASGFVQYMITKMPDESQTELFSKWKEEYALGFLKRAFPEIYVEILTMPEYLRAPFAVMTLEKQIMPGVQKEILSSVVIPGAEIMEDIGQLANHVVPIMERLDTPFHIQSIHKATKNKNKRHHRKHGRNM